ncbi:MAG: uracil-DNA glycosylase [Alphaproteobacteria bacterium]|nr:uracil-DNA glycosylase [Alphaproteobacteria bacterium]
MYNDALRDLDLAGVRWEITELPTATAAALAAAEREAAANAPTGPTTAADDIQIPDSARTPVYSSGPVVVPRIAPISVETAAAAAARPTDTDAMLRMISEFNHPLRAMAHNTVLPHVAPNSNGLLIITDIPGADDDAAGKILTGGAGDLLDKMIAAIGMSRDNVSIMPVLFWRTPGGRAPTRGELDLARPFVNRMIELIKPRVIITMGTLAATEIAHVDLAKNHGIAQEIDGRIVMPIFHPNYLLLKPAAKRDAWNALQAVQNMLKSA